MEGKSCGKQFLRSHVGIGSNSHDLFCISLIILETSSNVKRVKADADLFDEFEDNGESLSDKVLVLYDCSSSIELYIFCTLSLKNVFNVSATCLLLTPVGAF